MPVYALGQDDFLEAKYKVSSFSETLDDDLNMGQKTLYRDMEPIQKDGYREGYSCGYDKQFESSFNNGFNLAFELIFDAAHKLAKKRCSDNTMDTKDKYVQMNTKCLFCHLKDDVKGITSVDQIETRQKKHFQELSELEIKAMIE